MKFIGDKLNNLEEAGLAALLFLMTGITFSQVVARYIFNSGWIASLEVVTTFFKIIVIMGISWGIREKAHLGIDLVLRFFQPRVRRILVLLVIGAIFAYGAIMLYGGWGYFWHLYKLGIEMSDLTLPRWVPTIFFPLGMLLVLFRLSILALRVWRREEEHILQNEAEAAIQSTN